MKIISLKQWLPSRTRKQAITTLVFHATAGASAASSIAWLWQLAKNAIKGDEASYHYIIERDGETTKCVSVSRVAFHSGKSVGPQGKNVNEHSIGIAFANMNNGEKITEAQNMAAKQLVALLLQHHAIKHFTTHKAVSPGRKSDPVGWEPEVIGLTGWRQ